MNRRLTQAAWYGLEHEKYDFAVAASDECVGRFGRTAERLEKSLASAPEPPVGKVPDDVRDSILRNGVLNDVATCYWIKGRAEQISHNLENAREAYCSTGTLAHARTWDLRGWFWSPAVDATDRLEDLK
jgi:hypothetical protein